MKFAKSFRNIPFALVNWFKCPYYFRNFTRFWGLGYVLSWTAKGYVMSTFVTIFMLYIYLTVLGTQVLNLRILDKWEIDDFFKMHITVLPIAFLILLIYTIYESKKEVIEWLRSVFERSGSRFIRLFTQKTAQCINVTSRNGLQIFFWFIYMPGFFLWHAGIIFIVMSLHSLDGKVFEDVVLELILVGYTIVLTISLLWTSLFTIFFGIRWAYLKILSLDKTTV